MVLCKKGHAMALSEYTGDGYSSGWSCDECGSGFDGGSRRHFCRPCQTDYCEKCAPKHSVLRRRGAQLQGSSGAECKVRLRWVPFCLPRCGVHC